LLDDTSYWVVLGIVLSGIVAAALPATFFEQYLNNELASMLVMLAIGIPIYVCASEATPLAAALVMKGLNPGAALVFLRGPPPRRAVMLLSSPARVMAIYHRGNRLRRAAGLLRISGCTELGRGFARYGLYRHGIPG
jgi:hypothetical protein